MESTSTFITLAPYQLPAIKPKYFNAFIHCLLYKNLTKPEITKIIEGSETSDSSPTSRAKTLLQGLNSGYFSITSDIVTDLFRCASLGTSPKANLLADTLLEMLAWV